MLYKTIHFPMFENRIDVYVSSDMNLTIKHINKKHSLCFDLCDGDEKALTLSDFSELDDKARYFIIVTGKKINDVVHEAIHVSWEFLVNGLGCKFTDDGEELQAYFVGYLVENIMSDSDYELI